MNAFIINAFNPNDALAEGLWHLKVSGQVADSRNGRVLVAPGPVITEYENPLERVLFAPLRDANPFFHLYESLWMLAGRNDSASVAVYASQMSAFAEDGILHGAYGFRWREYFAFDQLTEIIKLLRNDPTTRRAVLTMWAPNGDLVASEGVGGVYASKDVPCNTQVYFDATRGGLDMTVCNRSNDIVWGAYGANAVHMSFLQEFIASALNTRVGRYYQFSNNFHMYLDRPDCQRLMSTEAELRDHWHVIYQPDDRYQLTAKCGPYPLLAKGENPDKWLEDCEAFVNFPTAHHYRRCEFFPKVAAPLMQAHAMWRTGDDFVEAARIARTCAATDWGIAASEWLLRREAKRVAGEEK